MNKKELRCVTKAGNMESEEGNTAEKTSHDQGVKNVGKCTCLSHVTSGVVSYGSFHLAQMSTN